MTVDPPDSAGPRAVVGTIHQLKVTLRGIHPPIWRRVHVPSTATLAELHEVIQVAMGWEQHHLHVFGRGDLEYGDNARDETAVTLASLIGRAGDWLGYRYDFGDCWDHDIEVEKVHRAAKKATYPRCSAGGRACPPEDSGGPEGYIEHMRALRHRKGWKYRVAKSILGTTRWDPAKWDRAEVNAGLAGLAKLWAKQAAARVKQEAKASPTPSAPVNDRPENGRFRDGRADDSGHRRSRRNDRPETRPETTSPILEFRDGFRDSGGMNATPRPSAAAGPSAGPVANAIRVGYARISTRAQDHLSQMEALGAAHCREIVEETASTRTDRPKLRAAVERMHAGDTLVIYKPDRVARSVKELLVFLEDELAPRGINLEILSGICAGIHRPNGQSVADKMLFLVAAMAAEMERDLISERTLDGLAAARAAGRTGGRPAAVSDDLLAAARARRARGQSVTQIARELGVGRSTLYRALETDEPPVAEPVRPVLVDVGQALVEASAEPAGTPAAPAAPSAGPTPEAEVDDGQGVEATGTADVAPAPVDQPPAAEPRRAQRGAPAASTPAAAAGVPWTSEADPIRRRRWYTGDELNAVQVVKTGRGDGASWVIIAGELLGTVAPHHGARGGRSGWEARHRGGSTVEHLGAGKRAATRQAAVIDLVAAVERAWHTHRERRKRDARLRKLEAR